MAIDSLDYMYVIQGVLALYKAGDGTPFRFETGQFVDPQMLKKQGIKTIQRVEIEGICHVLAIPNAECRKLYDVQPYMTM